MSSSKRPGSSSSAAKKGLKQGNLFSFFTKKPPAASPSASASAPTNAPAPSNAAPDCAKAELWQQVSVGQRIEVYWPNDKTYYPCTITGQRSGRGVFFLTYDDGEEERVDLSTETFRLLKEEPNKGPASKKRRIHEDTDEEEFQLEDSASEDGDDESAYEQDEAAAEEEPEEDEEQLMDTVTDDEEDPEPPRKNKKPRFQVTEVQPAKATIKVSNSVLTPIRPSVTAVVSATKTPGPQPARLLTPSPSQGSAPLTYVEGALNPAGSHLHNHLKFLRNPTDSQGRTANDPNYDPHTLRVDYQELERGKKLTPASRQWWEIKAQYYDTVLLFKTGMFLLNVHLLVI